MQRIYVIVRGDLEPGAQMAQSGHAAFSFALAHAAACRAWQATDNNLVVLAAKNEAELDALRMRLSEVVERRIHVHEPDLGWQLTAIAFEGNPIASRMVASLPLALRNPQRSASTSSTARASSNGETPKNIEAIESIAQASA